MNHVMSMKGFIRLTKKTLVMSLIAILIFTGTGLYLLIHPKPAAAAWYDDNWAYKQSLRSSPAPAGLRTSYSNNNTGAAVTNQKIKLDIDTKVV